MRYRHPHVQEVAQRLVLANARARILGRFGSHFSTYKATLLVLSDGGFVKDDLFQAVKISDQGAERVTLDHISGQEHAHENATRGCGRDAKLQHAEIFSEQAHSQMFSHLTN